MGRQSRSHWVLLICFMGFSTASAQEDPEADVLREGAARLGANQSSQQQIEGVHNQTRDLQAQYQNGLKVIDGLKVYNALLERQLDNQQENIQTLQGTIANATVIERQIVPLLMRMLDGLDTFIALDLPFDLEERQQRVAKLRALMERADLTVAEKTRRVFEAFQIENDYGRTLESYKGKIALGDKSFDVEYLRVGRVALMYRSVGGDNFGYWNNRAREWVPVTASQYRRNIGKGIKMANQEMAPEFLTVPIPPAEDVL